MSECGASLAYQARDGEITPRLSSNVICDVCCTSVLRFSVCRRAVNSKITNLGTNFHADADFDKYTQFVKRDDYIIRMCGSRTNTLFRMILHKQYFTFFG